MHNIVCVKWGTKYSPEYVNILKEMVKRNVTLPYRFVCFTENTEGLHSDIETHPLPPLPIESNNRNHGWWFKLSLFQNKLADLQGKTLYMDLDVVIVDNIDCLLTYSDEFSIIRDWNSRENKRIWYNSSVFTYHIGKHSHLWDKFILDPTTNMKSTNGGDQIWITNNQPNANFFPGEWCKSYKYQCQNGIPDNSKIIIFHGKPDPHEAENWPGMRNKKYPTDWIKEYWKL